MPAASAAAPDAARVAACAAAAEIGGMSYSTFDASIERLLGLTTGNLHDNFESRRESIRALLTQSRAEAQVSAIDCTITSGDERTATVHVNLTQVTRNVESDQPRTSSYGMTVVAENVDGQWLVSSADVDS
ncbi:hypothetical protein [Nocardia jejuensis]|uniref:hypothetical protein n=1 Tax=Nocardia jejuensis TaxID=328049 RepID=UPI00083402FD|nr:hypothetical protein [Nocardia jejuensis]